MNPAGKLMKARRKTLAMSQQDLAVRIGVHAASIGQIERGVQHPRRETAQLIDEALGAGGAVLLAFGFNNANGELPAAVVSQLDERYLLLDEAQPALDEFARLTAAVKSLQRRVARLEAAAGHPGRSRRSSE